MCGGSEQDYAKAEPVMEHYARALNRMGPAGSGQKTKMVNQICIAGVLGIRYRALADGEFNHTSALVLLDAHGRELARTEKLGGTPDPAFIAAVRKATSAK